jgi:hypothetical protein
MSAMDWAAFLVSIFAIIAGFATGIRWMVIHYLKELKTNGGSSIKDQVNSLQIKVDLIYDIVTNKRK